MRQPTIEDNELEDIDTIDNISPATFSVGRKQPVTLWEFEWGWFNRT